jgi:hypothetical protein
MNATLNSLKEAYGFLNQLKIHPEKNALWELIHLARWHKGIDWVMWIGFNKKLVYEIVKYERRMDFPEELTDRVWDSIFKIKKLDR